jgi:hypothetical protein
VLLLKGYEYERLQNIGGYISRFKLRAILIETLLALTQKALKTYIYWCCNDCARRRDYKKRKYVSNQPAKQRSFVKNLKLILSMKRRVATVRI